MGSDEAVDRVQYGVKATRREQTAALRFVGARMDSTPSFQERLGERQPGLAAGFSAFKGARRHVISELGASEISGPAGRIDFVNDRSVYSKGEGNGWALTAPGRDFVGEPGEWEQEIHHDETISDDEPFWLIELVGGTVEATSQGVERVLGHDCHRYRLVSNLTVARAHSSRFIGPPRTPDPLDLDRLDVELWLDDQDRVRQARFHGNQTVMLLELSDFGVPDPIELPPPDEIIDTFGG